MPLWRDPRTLKWKMRYYLSGSKAGPRVLETHPAHLTFAEADRIYKMKLAKAAGRRGRAVPRDLTVKEASSQWLAAREGSWAPGTFRAVSSVVSATIVRLLGDRRVDSLRPSDFLDYQKTRKEEGAASSTVNKEMELLRGMFNALAKWEWIDRNPMPEGSVTPLRAPKGRTDFFSVPEWRKLLEALAAVPEPAPGRNRQAHSTSDLIPVIRTLLYTGGRLTEILTLTWGDVNLEERHLILSRRKTDSVTGLRISPQLAEVLEALPRGTPAAYVFTRPDGLPWEAYHVQRAFYRARDRAKLRKSLTVHSLRHTFASWLVADGVPLKTVSELLGHSSVNQTERYAHLAPSHLAAAVDRIGDIESRGATSGGTQAPRKTVEKPLDRLRKR